MILDIFENQTSFENHYLDFLYFLLLFKNNKTVVITPRFPQSLFHLFIQNNNYRMYKILEAFIESNLLQLVLKVSYICHT